MHRLFAKCQDKVVGVTGEGVVLATRFGSWVGQGDSGFSRQHLRQSFSVARSPSEVGTVEAYIVGFKCYTGYEDLSRDWTGN